MKKNLIRDALHYCIKTKTWKIIHLIKTLLKILIIPDF